MIEIPLTRNQVALIDDDDFELVSQYKWNATIDRHTHTYYAITKIYIENGKRKTIIMHRLILNAGKGDIVDHIDMDTLNNSKSNLRLCTASQNGMNRSKQINNTSGYKGVCFDKRRNTWIAQITKKGKHYSLGRFSTPELAYNAYCIAATELHEDFCRVF